MPVYLDHNATTPLCAEARAAMTDALDRLGNPSSVHAFGADARRAVETAREQVAALAGCRPDEIVFTSGGTEANNLALLGRGETHLFVSAVEHDSVLAAARIAPGGCTVVPVDGDGVADLEGLRARLAGHEGPALVSLMLANNETGALQPVREAAAVAHEFGALVHCDAVQGPGKLALDLPALDADLVTLSAHKFGGPAGVGALAVRNGARLAARQVGGGQEGWRRAGTQNLVGIVGFGAAAKALRTDAAGVPARIAALRDRLEQACRALCDTRIFADAVPRLPNTACLTMPGVPAETQVMALDLAGVAVSAGAACSSGKVGPSHVLAAMGVPRDIAGTAIRVSLGRETTPADVDSFVAAWSALWRRTQAAPARRLAS